MGKGRPQFIGAAGQFYVSYGLSVREINACITLGNAPSVDVLASTSDGKRTLAFQVKTSRSAHRRSRYGREGWEWDVGAGAMKKSSDSFWYAFVDLQETKGAWTPRVFFVPSRWVAEFVKPGFSRFIYFLPKTAEELTCEKWQLVKDFLSGDQSAVDWATSWPEDKLVKWGKDS